METSFSRQTRRIPMIGQIAPATAMGSGCVTIHWVRAGRGWPGRTSRYICSNFGMPMIGRQIFGAQKRNNTRTMLAIHHWRFLVARDVVWDRASPSLMAIA